MIRYCKCGNELKKGAKSFCSRSCYYNSRIGTKREFTETHRENMSKSQKGRKLSQDKKDKISNGLHERFKNGLSLEHKKKIGDKNRAAWARKTKEEKLEILENAHSAKKWISSLEELVKIELETLNIHYAQQKHILGKRVDFYLPSVNAVLEVNGCHWHSCESCNKEFGWQMERFRADGQVYLKLRQSGYNVVILRGCDIKRYKKDGLLNKFVFEQIHRPTIHEYYIEMAEIVAMRSTCKRIQVGAIVTKDGQICSTGYNGSPSGMPHCIDHECILINDHCVASIHAETNALMQAGKDTFGSDLYTTHLCCIDCCKLVINCGIKRLFYLNNYADDRIELFGVNSQIDYLQKAGIFVENVVPKYYQLRENSNSEMPKGENNASNNV